MKIIFAKKWIFLLDYGWIEGYDRHELDGFQNIRCKIERRISELIFGKIWLNWFRLL